VKDAFGVDEEDPGILVKRLLEFADVIIIKSIDVKFYNTSDLVVVSYSCGHLDLPFAGLFAVVSRVDRAASGLSLTRLRGLEPFFIACPLWTNGLG
jgi:hypothetical protein